MINYLPQHQGLVVVAEQDSHDLALELRRHPCVELSIHGTPSNLAAINDHPTIEVISLHKCDIHDLGILAHLPRLRRLDIGFGPLANVDLRFCADSLENLQLTRLKNLKNLSALPPMPQLEQLTLNHLHGFQPPDFSHFPNLHSLSIWKTEWPNLRWLAQLPVLQDLHISQIKVDDQDWRPLLEIPHLKNLHGLRDVFKSAAKKEFQRLRPNVRVDQGIPVDLERNPRLKEFLEEQNSRHPSQAT